MYSIEIHKQAKHVISFFYFIGLWSGDIRSDSSRNCLKIMHIIVCACCGISVCVGSFVSNNTTEATFLVVLSIGLLIHLIKMYYFLWMEDEIVRFVHSMGTHSIKEFEKFKEFNNKINTFGKLAFLYSFTIFCAVIVMSMAALPFISNKRGLPLNVYSPFNWKENLVSYWIAFASVVCLMTLCMLYTLFYPIFWYVMICCGIKYQTLGNELRNLGKTTLNKKVKILVAEKENVFLEKLIELITKHKRLQEYKHCRLPCKI